MTSLAMLGYAWAWRPKRAVRGLWLLIFEAWNHLLLGHLGLGEAAPAF